MFFVMKETMVYVSPSISCHEIVPEGVLCGTFMLEDPREKAAVEW